MVFVENCTEIRIKSLNMGIKRKINLNFYEKMGIIVVGKGVFE